MKFLVIGLGSMGKRRIRNLQALGHQLVYGFDTRKDRIEEASAKYGVPVYHAIDVAIAELQPDVFIICTPPDLHMHYAFMAARLNINCFMPHFSIARKSVMQLAH
jgi:predicted dehydrogenase